MSGIWKPVQESPEQSEEFCFPLPWRWERKPDRFPAPCRDTRLVRTPLDSDGRTSGRPLDVVGVVRQVVLQSVGDGQVLDPPGRPVDADPTQVLQRRDGGVHGPDEEQLHGAIGARRRRRGAAAGPGQLDVVLHQVDHAVELLQLGLHQNHRVQFELPVPELDAQVGGAGGRHGGDGEQEVPLGAVPQQEAALRRVLQDLFGLVGRQAAPVPTWPNQNQQNI